KRFYIHKLDNGRPYKPNIIFYSEEFSEESKEISKDQVIQDFYKIFEEEIKKSNLNYFGEPLKIK
ncbi:MAG: hypothetical protein KAW66_05835, partial [Candidatus Lokiarchaeota archaeon]|nr:hypothetical protein [Candidatus Lokiarchaeota archaeon]